MKREPHWRSCFVVIVCVFWIGAPGPQWVLAAPPAVTAIIPAGGQRGAEISVNLQGTVDAQNVQVWSDRPGLEVVSRSGKDGLTLRFPAETPPGLAWLSYANSEGAGPLRPFVIGALPEVAEKEPNQSLTDAQVLSSLPTTVNGTLAKSGDVDHYAVDLTAGQSLVAWLDSRERLESPLDGILQIVGPRGFVVAQNDDDRGFDPRVAFQAPIAGRYVIRVFGFPAQPDSSIRFIGGANYFYRLTLSTGPTYGAIHPTALTLGATMPVSPWGWNLPDAAAAFPVTLHSDGAQPLPLELDALQRALVWGTAYPVLAEAAVGDTGGTLAARPVALAGVLSKPNERDRWKFTVKKGERLAFRGIARALGSSTDLVLRMFDPGGKSLQQVDDAVQDEADVVLEWTAPADGDYQLEVRDRFAHGGPEYRYVLVVAPVAPSVSLTVNADVFNATAEKPLEIPVTVLRRGGHNQPVRIEVRELPEGVTVAPLVSEPKGPTAQEVKLQVTSTRIEPWSGPLKIVGVTEGDSPSEAQARPGLGNQSSRRPFALLWVVPKPAPKP